MSHNQFLRGLRRKMVYSDQLHNLDYQASMVQTNILHVSVGPILNPQPEKETKRSSNLACQTLYLNPSCSYIPMLKPAIPAW